MSTSARKRALIPIGITTENDLVFIKIDTEGGYYSITHDTFDAIVMSEEEGETRARESLEDGEIWRSCVEAKSTEESLSDWVENVLDIDGWQHVLDVKEFGSHDDVNYYLNWTSCGASIDDLKKDYSKLLITEAERQLLIESDRLHLKPINKLNKKDKALLKQVLKLAEAKHIDSIDKADYLLPDLLAIKETV